jgi:cell division protein FtsB
LASRSTRASKPGRVLVRRLLWGAGTLGVLWFAMEGGEYGTRDLVRQRAQKAALQDTLDLLREAVDSLQRDVKLVTGDPARLERLAREQWGMVKGDKELLYWTIGERTRGAVDSTVADSTR